LLLSNIKKEICGILDFSLSFLDKYEKKIHYTFSLMLDLRFKNLYTMFSFVGREQGVVV
jgi:hypothetical protein